MTDAELQKVVEHMLVMGISYIILIALAIIAGALLGQWLFYNILDKPKPKDKYKVAKVWSRKGQCPFCNVSTGSKHSKNCRLRKK